MKTGSVALYKPTSPREFRVEGLRGFQGRMCGFLLELPFNNIRRHEIYSATGNWRDLEGFLDRYDLEPTYEGIPMLIDTSLGGGVGCRPCRVLCTESKYGKCQA